MSQVLDLMISTGMLIDLNIKKIVQSLVQPMTIEEKSMIDNKMEILEIDEEQAHKLQIIAQGWAYPLQRFMNEQEMLECLHKESPHSIPITQHISSYEKEKLEGIPHLALRFKNNILAIIE